MKKFILFLYIVLSFSFTACGQWGAGVAHSNVSPVDTPQYRLKPSLLWYDSTTQSFYANNKTDWWLLMSPQERYVRGFINIFFAEGQTIAWSVIDGMIRQQAGGNTMKLNGFYLVKCAASGGNLTATATVDLNALSNVLTLPEINVTNNDYLLCRYYKNVLKQVQHLNDNTDMYLYGIEDSLQVHRTEIDTLKSKQAQNAWLLGGNINTKAEKLGTKSNTRVDIITRDTIRGVITEGGKFGFGVTDPTQTADVSDMRNRGVYIDGYGTGGVNNQVLKSRNGKTRWEQVFSSLHFSHTPPDSFVQLGKGNSFLAINDRGGQQIGYVALRFFSEQSSGSVTGSLKKRNANVPHTETTLATFTVTAPQPHLKFNINSTTFASGDIIFFEVTNITGTPPKGLSFAFDYYVN